MRRGADLSREAWELCVETAAAFPIEEYCRRVGIPVVRCGRGWRHAEYDSLKIQGSLWKRWSGKTGAFGRYAQGSAIQFVQEAEGVGFRDAVVRLVEMADPGLLQAAGRIPRDRVAERLRNVRAQRNAQQETPSAERKQLVLPRKSRCAEDVFAYLTKVRRLDPDLVKRELAAGRLYQDLRRNCVFVGRGEDGQPAYACLRGTNPDRPFKMDQAGSRKECGWRVEPDSGAQRVLAFESPIEALSCMSLLKAAGRDWERSAYLSLGGVSGPALLHFLEHARRPVAEIILCLNNDDAGRDGAERLAGRVAGRARVRITVPAPEGADWNDLLRAGRCEVRTRTPVPARER